MALELNSSAKRYLDAVEQNDLAAAKEVMDILRDGGADLPAIIDEVIAPAQREVGRRWQTGDWTVAQEHAATDLAYRVVAQLDANETADRADFRVMVASAEGEWHSLGPHLVALALRSFGHPVTALGGPVPAGQLLPLIHDVGPQAIVVSCSLPANLVGAHRVIGMARDTSIPVVVGGNALTPARAAAIGAHGYFADVRTLEDNVLSIDRSPPPNVPHDPEFRGEYEVISRNLNEYAARISLLVEEGSVDAASVGDAVLALKCLQASLLCRDATIFSDQIGWQRTRAKCGAVEPEAVLEALSEVVPPSASHAHALLAQLRDPPRS